MYCSTFLSALGACSYCGMLLLGTGGRSIADFSGLLLVARVIDGTGSGLVCQLGSVSLVNMMPSDRRPEWMATYQFACMLGIGLGPMVASLIGVLNVCSRQDFDLQATGVAYVSLAVANLLIAVLVYPRSLEDVIDHQSPSEDSRQETPSQMGKRGWVRFKAAIQKEVAHLSPATSDSRHYQRVIVLLATLVMATVRGFVIVGLESALAFLLESRYGWNVTETGIAIGCCFLSCIPFQLLYSSLRNQMAVTSWIRCLSICSIIGSCLLYKGWFGGVADSIALLAAASILFPALYLGDSLTSGISVMAHNVCPPDSMLSPNMLMLYRQFAVNGVGRCFGSVVANKTAEQAGQNAYATQQLVCAVVFWALLETLVVPFNKTTAQDATGSEHLTQSQNPPHDVAKAESHS